MTQITNIPQVLQISDAAHQKMCAYSRLVNEHFHQNMECYGFLLNPANIGNLVVYDVALAHGQQVSAVAVTAGAGTFKTKTEMEQNGYEPIGCWHSHHDMGAWHSSTDDRNLEKLVDELGITRILVESVVPSTSIPTMQAISKRVLTLHSHGLDIKVCADRSYKWHLEPNTKVPDKEMFDMYQLAVQLDGAMLYIDSTKSRASHPRPVRVEYEDQQYSLAIPNLQFTIRGEREFEKAQRSGICVPDKNSNSLNIFTKKDTYSFLTQQPQVAPQICTQIAYSVVVSNKETYAQVCQKVTGPTGINVKREEVPVEIIDSPKEIVLDDATLLAQIKERIKQNGRDNE